MRCRRMREVEDSERAPLTTQSRGLLAIRSWLNAVLLVIAAVASLNVAYGRERISLDANWRFRLGDPVDVTTNVSWYPEVSDLAKLTTDGVGAGTNTETFMESIRVDIFATHAGENV